MHPGPIEGSQNPRDSLNRQSSEYGYASYESRRSSADSRMQSRFGTLAIQPQASISPQESKE